MGMSASQARLLTITGRLTDNEMRSQTITNAKLRLAQKSSEASQTYMDALSSEKLVFKTYDSNGASSSNNLTPALLYSYEPLKNQYSIQNASGQNLVSATDAKNFEESNDLAGFLKKYGLVDQENINGSYQSELEKYNKYLDGYNAWAEKNKTYNDYLARKNVWQTDHDAWVKEKAAYDKAYKYYENELTNYNSIPNLYNTFTSIVGTKDNPSSCYKKALNNNTSCYVHVLAHLLDYTGGDTVSSKDYTASNGNTVKFASNDVSDSAIYSPDEKSKDFIPLSKEIAKETKYCDGDDNSNTSDVKENIIQAALDAGREPTELEILKSDYKYDQANKKVLTNSNGEPQLKTLKQKAIDLLYILKNNLITDQAEMKETLINFTDGDMKKLDAAPQPPAPIREEPVFTEEAEVPGEPPKEVKEPILSDFDFTLNDKDKAQWYVNLWYMMNGSETANKVKSSTNETGQTIYGLARDNDKDNPNNVKSQNTKNYKVIDDELLTSSDWLTFALKNGVVTLKQASYFNPATDSSKVATMTAEGYYWNATAYSSTTDIVSVEDEVAIAKAEVKYKNTTTEIENQDKKYDQDLKKLDTEHNALQTEYESLKNVIDKNVERSFKAFS